MEKCCKICKLSNENDEGAVLFQAPQETKKRKSWSKACGVFLTKKCLVCQKHFGPNDFIGKKNGIKLKANALPIHDADEPKDKDPLDECPLAATIKTEPPELVLVSLAESKDEPAKEHDAFLDVNVKVETESETVEPLVLIHEARFDEENSNAESNIPENDNVTKAFEKRICAQVENYEENGHEIFKLKCNFCDMDWQISYWPYFIDHIKAFHNRKDTEKKLTIEVPASLTPITTEVAKDKETNSEANKDEEQKREIQVDQEETADVTETLQTDESATDSEDSEKDEIKDNDKDYEPKSKKAKIELKVKKQRSSVSSNKAIKEGLIFFGHREEQCVLDFLELIKSNPILWHRRISIMKRFDEALEKCTTEFNAKWKKYEMTNEQSRTSINRIKDLYQRVTDPTHKRHIKNSAHLKKYPKYFDICAEIEENSKKITNPCDHCRAFFFNEIDLQVHKFKLHRIGELPFKCSRCKYGFSKAEKLAEHEQKHHRSKLFTCNVCNKRFFDENKLHAHEAVHSNDYKPVCEVCGKIFTTQSKYRHHRLLHDSPKEKCHICGKSYYKKWNLSEHIKSHRNERLYQCDICGKSFNHQNDVTIHKRGVHNVKPEPRKYVWVQKSLADYNDDVNDFL